ncbi:hypothetical protein PR003_g15748 [Phytophthora rubi]|uniref:Uncharacterized protein n=1 Tax=Phytophthora rubi TaxID=129364 RepID=A0A6A3M9G3_9STRA|nr:hypothetical protein PR002_g10471 [Phytophthora rubi]KAE9040387.1 hypothetical protein PR001_g7090 [Phytophthora rubi]KAE9328603.1 hypothetical protein PR003_g15748 [Phytophthora rubi]
MTSLPMPPAGAASVTSPPPAEAVPSTPSTSAEAARATPSAPVGVVHVVPSATTSAAVPPVGIPLAPASIARLQDEPQLQDEYTAVPAGPGERNWEAFATSVSAIHVALPLLDQDAVRSSIDHLLGGSNGSRA